MVAKGGGDEMVQREWDLPATTRINVKYRETEQVSMAMASDSGGEKRAATSQQK